MQEEENQCIKTIEDLNQQILQCKNQISAYEKLIKVSEKNFVM